MQTELTPNHQVSVIIGGGGDEEYFWIECLPTCGDESCTLPGRPYSHVTFTDPVRFTIAAHVDDDPDRGVIVTPLDWPLFPSLRPAEGKHDLTPQTALTDAAETIPARRLGTREACWFTPD